MAETLIGTFDVSKENIKLGDYTIPMGAFAQTYLNIKRTTPEKFTMKVGAGGGVTRNKVLDDSATVEITLKQQHPANDVLRNFASTDATFAFSRVNKSTREEKSIGAEAWIQADPDQDGSNEESDRTWVIGVAQLAKI